jgi:hypothetical protein
MLVDSALAHCESARGGGTPNGRGHTPRGGTQDPAAGTGSLAKHASSGARADRAALLIDDRVCVMSAASIMSAALAMRLLARPDPCC